MEAAEPLPVFSPDFPDMGCHYKMRKNKSILILFFITAALLFLINRDILQFDYAYPYGLTFSPTESEKGNRPLTDLIPLKAGTYTLRFESSASGKGSGCYLADASDEILFADDIPEGETSFTREVRIPQTTAARVGFSYDPQSGDVSIEGVTLHADHLLTKESLLRHFLLSLPVCLLALWGCLRLGTSRFTTKEIAYWEKVLIFLIFLTLLSNAPFLIPGKGIEGNDYYFHVSRIEGLAESLKTGPYPVRIYLRWMENYGVGAGFYYPDVFLYIPALLCLAGFSSLGVYKFFTCCTCFFALLAMYITARQISGGKTSAAIAAVLVYTFAVYRQLCFLERTAVGEMQAFIFIPIIVWGLAELFRGNEHKWPLVMAGFLGLLFSHLLSLAIASAVTAVYLLCRIRTLIRRPGIILSMAKAAVTTIGIGAFFLLPMLEQASRVTLNVNRLLEKEVMIKPQNLTAFRCLFFPARGWWVEPVMPYTGLLITLIPGLYLLIRRYSDRNLTDPLILFGALCFFAGTDAFPWQLCSRFLLYIQYSWRFFTPGTILLCLGGGLSLSSWPILIKRPRAVFTALFFVSLLSGVYPLIDTFSRLLPADLIRTDNRILSGAEYIPLGFDENYVYDNRDTIHTEPDGVRITGQKRSGLSLSFSYEAPEATEEIRFSLPKFYYYGYRGEQIPETGTPTPIPVQADKIGLISAVSSQSSGKIRVFYEKTTLQKVGECISLLSLLLFGIFRFGSGNFSIRPAFIEQVRETNQFENESCTKEDNPSLN